MPTFESHCCQSRTTSEVVCGMPLSTPGCWRPPDWREWRPDCGGAASDAARHVGAAHTLDIRRRAELFILPQRGFENRRALIGRPCVGKVLTCSSCLERIAEPLILG